MRHIAELRVNDSDDPDGTRAAAVLGAYYHLERLQVLCRPLWRGAAALGLGWMIVAGLMPGISGTTLGIGLGTFCAVGIGAIVAEWLAVRKLHGLLGALPRNLARHDLIRRTS